MAMGREVGLFSAEGSLGIMWAEGLFAGRGGGAALGEGSMCYIHESLR